MYAFGLSENEAYAPNYQSKTNYRIFSESITKPSTQLRFTTDINIYRETGYGHTGHHPALIMAGYRQLPPSQPQSGTGGSPIGPPPLPAHLQQQHPTNRGHAVAMYANAHHHPMNMNNSHGIVYAPATAHSMHGPSINMQQHHHPHHHQLMARHHLVGHSGRHNSMLHQHHNGTVANGIGHGGTSAGINMTSIMPLNASK